MANIQVSVINASTVLTDDEVQAAVPAFQTQVRNDFAPVWGIDADLTFVPQGSSPAPGSWWLVIFDNSDMPGALGYHDVTNEGLPLGKVFAGTDLQLGFNWTITATHELLEMLADPEINLSVFVQSSARRGIIYAYEVCDACEADEFGYDVGGTFVSDFVYPAWFETSRPAGSTQFDQGNQLQGPLPKLLRGGYIGAFDVTSGTGWHQVKADVRVARSEFRPRVGSRRERRATPRDQWITSKVAFKGTARRRA